MSYATQEAVMSTNPSYAPSAGALATQAANEELPETEVIQTRFGQVTISRKNPLKFPKGMLGIPDRFAYCLTSMPSPKLAKFKLLQSLEELELSFITLPFEPDNSIITRADVTQALEDLKIAPASAAMMFIVSVHRRPGAVQLSVNARAPIFVDAQKREASQYVFNSNKYAIQHMITM